MSEKDSESSQGLPPYDSCSPSEYDSNTTSAPILNSQQTLPSYSETFDTPSAPPPPQNYNFSSSQDQTYTRGPHSHFTNDYQKLPEGWKPYYDETQTAYYYNTLTGATQWEFPTEPASSYSTQHRTPQTDANNHTNSNNTYGSPNDSYPESSLAEMIEQMKRICKKNTSSSIDSTLRSSHSTPLYGPSGLFSQSLNPNIINAQQLSQHPLIIEDNKQLINPKSCCQQFWATQLFFTIINILFLLALTLSFLTYLIKLNLYIPQFMSGMHSLPLIVLSVLYFIIIICPIGYYYFISPKKSTAYVHVDIDALDSPQSIHKFLHIARFLCFSSYREQRDKDINEVIEYYNYIQKQRPVLSLHVECWHNEAIHNNNDNSSTYHNTNETKKVEKKVVTYTNKYSFPILGWRDISQSASGLKNSLLSAKYNHIAIQWQHGFVLHSSQVELVEESKRLVTRNNLWRDEHCDVKVEFSLQTSSGQNIEYHDNDLIFIDAVSQQQQYHHQLSQQNTAQKPTVTENICSNSITQFFLSRFGFLLSVVCGWYIIPAAIFCSEYQQILVHNIKFIHINLPPEVLDSIPPTSRHFDEFH